ncbi:unnamed protein product, partial [Ascophyllum nodosum]
SSALDDLRVLAASCRACSSKGYVEGILRRRGTKDVDLRAAGVTVRFDLEPDPLEARAGNGGARDADPVVDADRKDSGRCTGDTTRHPPGGAPEGSDAGNG